jgi:hypothetical protein
MMTSKAHCYIAFLAAALFLAGGLQSANAGMTLARVVAADPENQPGLLRYEYDYVNDAETGDAFVLTVAVAQAVGGGVPGESGWRFKLVSGGVNMPSFACWLAGGSETRIPPRGTLEGLYILSRAKPGPTRWGVGRVAEGQVSTEMGPVLGPAATKQVLQAVPPPLLDAGWNWISFPLLPGHESGGFDPALVLGGPAARMNLFRYHIYYKMYEYYPDDFNEVLVGRGYALWVRDGRLRPNYFGLPAGSDEIALVTSGWSLIGCPRNWPVPLAGVRVRNEVTGEVRTALEDASHPSPWLNWHWVYWDSVEDCAQILTPDSTGDDFALRPWLGYWVWANQERITVIVP